MVSTTVYCGVVTNSPGGGSFNSVQLTLEQGLELYMLIFSINTINLFFLMIFLITFFFLVYSIVSILYNKDMVCKLSPVWASDQGAGQQPLVQGIKYTSKASGQQEANDQTTHFRERGLRVK